MSIPVVPVKYHTNEVPPVVKVVRDHGEINTHQGSRIVSEFSRTFRIADAARPPKSHHLPYVQDGRDRSSIPYRLYTFDFSSCS